MMAPAKVPIILIPPSVGQKSKPIALPIEAPIKPAIMLPIIPNGTSLEMISPANQPRIPPTINVHNQPILYSS